MYLATIAAAVGELGAGSGARDAADARATGESGAERDLSSIRSNWNTPIGPNWRGFGNVST